MEFLKAKLFNVQQRSPHRDERRSHRSCPFKAECQRVPLRRKSSVSVSNQRDFISECLDVNAKVLNVDFSQGTFIDHAQIHGPVFPMKTPVPSAPKGLPSMTVSRPVSGTSVVQLRSITGSSSVSLFQCFGYFLSLQTLWKNTVWTNRTVSR